MARRTSLARPAVLAGFMALFLGACDSGNGDALPATPESPATAPATTSVPPPAPEPPAAPDPAPEDEIGLVSVKVETNMGDIVLELNGEKAPITVRNFLAYVDKGFYDGTLFHRVMPNFMIQGGGLTPDMREKPADPPIKNEWRNGLKNVRGAVAMARYGGQADSATSEFFINVVDNPPLDQPRDGAGYAVFGRVVSGMDVVDAIRAVPTGLKGRRANVPIEPVIIERVRRVAIPPAGGGD